MKSNFRTWTLDDIDKAFNTKEVKSLPALEKILNYKYSVDEFERKYLTRISHTYRYFGGESWNEVELENKIISPLIVFAEIDNEQFTYFLERDLSATIGEYELSGRVDGMIATGYRNPKKPYFCLSEYKKAKDPDGDPQGQALIAMLCAQHHNDDKLPIYGSYIAGRQWVFMALEGKKYTFSKSYTVDDDEVFDIYRILKGLKVEIEKRVATENKVSDTSKVSDT